MLRRLAFVACALVLVIATAHAQPSSHPKVAPPPPPAEAIPPVPTAHTTWVWRGGYYHWGGEHYVWVPGAYAEPPHAGYRWAPGRWRETPHGWVWVEGHWH
jgi:hypothetical protein